MISRQLNHYEIVQKLGEGGMGEVYVAHDDRLHRDVALKVLPPELANDPDRLERFEREAKTVAALNHPNIVTIYSVEEAEGLRFMTMELIEGRTLDELVPKEGMPVKEFLQVAIPLADAIAAAHAKGIQHRDLKPANVMVTDDGRVKVLDFGLAKVRRQSTGPEGVTQMLTGELTGEGKILGTVSYMSPEQAEGRALDHRSDIFSLGIVLYEMIIGRRPFDGDTNISILSSILKDEPESISDIRKALPIPIARVIARTLAKRPDQRYQSAIDLKQDLVDIKRDLDTGEALETGMYSSIHRTEDLPQRPGWLKPLGIGLAALAAIAVGGLAMNSVFDRPAAPPRPTLETIPAAFESPAVAVFYFDNISNDEELEWLRTGLADMLVTDLSQIPNLRVLGTDRLYSMLEEIGRLDDRTTSFDTVQSIAVSSRSNIAVVGSFARVGTQVRINARVQDASTGDVLSSESALGNTDEIFSLVDDLSGRIQASFEVPAMPVEMTDMMVDAGMMVAELEPETDVVRVGRRALKDMTTENVDAYRLYRQGVKLNLQSREEQAIPILEQAIELDPEFAMAFAKLSVAHGNEGDNIKELEYAKKALDLSHRLPPRERHYIEGRYYSLSPETQQRSIDAYAKTVKLFPDHFPARNNLAIGLFELGRYDDAIEHLEELRSQGHRFAGTFNSLANAYAVTGRLDEAIAVLRDYAEANPDNAEGHVNLAIELTRAGRYDAAREELARAMELQPSPRLHAVRWQIDATAEDWEAASEDLQAMADSGDDRAVFEGVRASAQQHLYFGRLSEARAAFERAESMLPAASVPFAQIMAERLDLARYFDEPEVVLEMATAYRETPMTPDKLQQLIVAEALAHARAGDVAASAAARDELLEAIAGAPISPRGRERIDRQVDAILALASRDHEAAAVALTAAIELLPSGNLDEQGPVLRYYLGEVLWGLGRTTEAAEQFRIISDSTLNRTGLPIAWVRSLWYLGKYHADRGDAEQARAYYRRFVDYWGDGEIDRDRVQEARAYLQ